MAKDASIDKQFIMARQVGKEEGWNLIGELSDKVGASRMSAGDRDDWEEVNRLVRTKALDVLILWESSRGDRDAETWLGFLKLCRANKVKIYVISNDRLYDIDRPRDWKDLANEGIDANYETEVLSRRTREGIAYAAALGSPPNVAPFGYRKVRDENTGKAVGMVPDRRPRPSTIPGQPDYMPADVVLKCFQIVADGGSQWSVMDYLHCAGIPAPHSSPDGRWIYKTIRQMLRRRIYMGHRTLGDKIVKENCFEPVVSPALWHQVNALFRSDQVPRKGGSRSVKYLLVGTVAKCGCSYRLTTSAPFGRRTWTAYRCDAIGCKGVSARDGHVSSARVTVVDDFVLMTTAAYLARPDFVALVSGSLNSERVQVALHHEIDDLTTQIAEWEAEARAARVKPAVYRDAVMSLEAQVAEKQAMLDRGQVPADLTWLLSANRVAEWHKRKEDLAMCRHVISHLFEITVSRPTDGKTAGRPVSEYVNITPRLR
jgi:DNA invertase Pin-like site-specific DNA recombinase